MITTVDVETSWQKTDTGGYDPSPFHPDNILVSVGINDEYYFTNHSERVDEGCYHKIQSILDKTTLLIGHNIKFDLMWLLESGFKYTGWSKLNLVAVSAFPIELFADWSDAILTSLGYNILSAPGTIF